MIRITTDNTAEEDFDKKLSKSLTIDDLRDSVFFHSVRILLNILLEMIDLDTATATIRNLNRKVIKARLDYMRLSKKVGEEARFFRS
jgi:phage-related holin